MKGGTMKTYHVTLLVNGYVQFRVSAGNEDQAIEKAEERLTNGLSQALPWKWELDYTDSPDVQIIEEVTK